MTTPKRFVAASSALAFLLLLGVAVVSDGVALAQTDPFDGTWVLNVTKSKYSPGPAPKSQTVVYAVSGQTHTVVAKGVGADGTPISTEYTATLDGKDYPVTGNPDWDTTSLKRIDERTIEFTRKKGGKVVQTGSNVVSKDGKSRTTTTKGVDAKGQKINNVAVYEKK